MYTNSINCYLCPLICIELIFLLHKHLEQYVFLQLSMHTNFPSISVDKPLSQNYKVLCLIQSPTNDIKQFSATSFYNIKYGSQITYKRFMYVSMIHAIEHLLRMQNDEILFSTSKLSRIRRQCTYTNYNSTFLVLLSH